MPLKSECKELNNWHGLHMDAVLEKTRSSAGGLSQDDVNLRLLANGPNRLPQAVQRSALLRFLLHFHNILIYVLLGSAVITAVLGHLFDTLVILAVVLANAVIGFVQEGKAETAMAAIRRMLAPRASVWRDGERRTVDGENLVTGDIAVSYTHLTLPTSDLV